MLKLKFPTKLKTSSEMYHCSSWHSEPYHQNQNPSEWCYMTIKAWTNTILNRNGVPANCWLLCMSYVCYLLYHISCESLKGQIPLPNFMVSPLTLASLCCTLSTNLFIMHPTINLPLPLVRMHFSWFW